MKILIVEDHPAYRDGIRALLQKQEEGIELLEAETGDEALTLVARYADLDLVLLDIKLPDVDGFEVMENLLNIQPTIPVIMLSASDDLEDMRKALDIGAMGYIPKSTSAIVMSSAIKLVLSGGVYVPPDMLKSHALQGSHYDASPVLTNRQRDVLGLLLEGQVNKQIANTLELSLPTVKAHVSAIFKALNVKNRTQAAIAAKRLNIIRNKSTD